MVSRKLTSGISLPACMADACADCLGMAVGHELQPLWTNDAPTTRGTRRAFLIAGEGLEVARGGTAQMAELKPEPRLENFLVVGDMREEYSM